MGLEKIMLMLFPALIKALAEASFSQSILRESQGSQSAAGPSQGAFLFIISDIQKKLLYYNTHHCRITLDPTPEGFSRYSVLGLLSGEH